MNNYNFYNGVIHIRLLGIWDEEIKNYDLLFLNQCSC